MKLSLLAVPFVLLASSAFAAPIDAVKSCDWIGGNDRSGMSHFEISVSDRHLTVTNVKGSEDIIKGNWIFAREFAGDKGQTYLEYKRRRGDGSVTNSIILEPQLTKTGTVGVAKHWFNTGDGFVANVFRCSDKR